MRIPDIQKVTPEYKGSGAPMHGAWNEKSRSDKRQEKISMEN
jgi:hypothetical protein